MFTLIIIQHLYKIIHMKNKISAFSLVEMSIVIVILGIIAAGIMGGKNLLESAKTRSIIAEFSQYKVAINSFSAKYESLPGDFGDAVSYWGTLSGNNANGDNDGKIEFKVGSVYEAYHAWQHLAFADMVNVAFLGTQTTSAAVLDQDVPMSKTGGGFFLEWGVFGLGEANAIVLGAPKATSAAPILVNGVLTPSQALSLDVKMDDGAPAKGSVRGKDGSDSTAANCVNVGTDTTPGTSDDFYNVSLSGKDCTIAVKF